MLFSDWDRSGRRDLRISNDRQYYVSDGEEQLFRVGASGDPRAYTADEGWERLQIFGMGIASDCASDCWRRDQLPITNCLRCFCSPPIRGAIPSLWQKHCFESSVASLPC